jgi:hypothetical protein
MNNADTWLENTNKNPASAQRINSIADSIFVPFNLKIKQQYLYQK